MLRAAEETQRANGSLCSSLQAEKDALTQQLERTANELSDTKTELRNAQAKFASEAARCSGAEQRLAALENEKAKLETDLSAVRRELELETNQRLALEQRLEAAKTELVSERALLEGTIHEFQQQLEATAADAELARANAEERIRILREEKERDRQSALALQAELDDARAALEGASLESVSLRNAVHEGELRLQSAQALAASLQNENLQLTEKLLEAQNALRATSEEFQSQSALLAADRELLMTLKSQKHRLEAELQDESESLSAARLRIDDVQSQLRKAWEQVSQVECERDKLAGQLAESQRLAACLEAELREEEEQSQSWRRSAEALQIQLDALGTRLQQVEHDWSLLNSAMAAEKQALHKDVEQLTRSLIEAEKRVKDAREELAQIQAEMTADLKRLGRELGDHKQRAQSALLELQQMQEAADVLHEETVTRAYEMECMAQRLLLASKANGDSKEKCYELQRLLLGDAAPNHDSVAAAEYMAQLAALRATEDEPQLILLTADEAGVESATAQANLVPHAPEGRFSPNPLAAIGDMEAFDAHLEQACVPITHSAAGRLKIVCVRARVCVLSTEHEL
jgi:chromosome segregation ATPase